MMTLTATHNKDAHDGVELRIQQINDAQQQLPAEAM